MFDAILRRRLTRPAGRPPLYSPLVGARHALVFAAVQSGCSFDEVARLFNNLEKPRRDSIGTQVASGHASTETVTVVVYGMDQRVSRVYLKNLQELAGMGRPSCMIGWCLRHMAVRRAREKG